MSVLVINFSIIAQNVMNYYDVKNKDILRSTDATFMELANCKLFRRLTCNKPYDNYIEFPSCLGILKKSDWNLLKMIKMIFLRKETV